MLLPRTDAEMVENAIERRLVQTMVSGGVRPIPTLGPVRRASSVGTGLFLVKPGMARMERRRPSRSNKVRTIRGANPRVLPVQQTERRIGPAHVIPMPIPAEQARQESLLGLMAALGPLLVFGHAALVWLKVV